MSRDTVSQGNIGTAAIVGAENQSTESPAPRGGYGLTRFNAVTHGILSRHAVLPHEDRGEFQALLDGFVAEHQPGGQTEMHLVEELAGIVWRKRRVLMAEAGQINRGIRNAVHNKHDSPVSAAAPFDTGLSPLHLDIGELMAKSPEEALAEHKDAQADLSDTEAAQAILEEGGPNAYKRALKKLRADSVEWWNQQVADGEYTSDADGLAAFIDDQLQPYCARVEKDARYHDAIKAQIVAEGLQPGRLDTLARYETHLDRKFQRTLAMLIKLQEIRLGGGKKATSA